MKKHILISIMTPKSMTNKKDAQTILGCLCKLTPELIPDVYGYWEPLRKKFDIGEILGSWPKHDIFWRRRKPQSWGMIFIRYGKILVHGSLDINMSTRSVEITKAAQLVKEISRGLGADLGYIQLVVKKMQMSEFESALIEYLGKGDIYYITTHELKLCIPELPWGTVLGPAYVNHFGRKIILNAPAPIVEELAPDMIYIQLSKDIFDLEKKPEDIDAVRHKVKKHLNRNSFFDPSLPPDHVYDVPEFRWVD